MNKQKVIEKIKACKTEYDEYDYETRDIWCYKKGFEAARSSVLNVVKQLDEPEKPVLNKNEAEWVEALKETFPNRENRLYIIARYGWRHQLSFNYHGEPFTLLSTDCKHEDQDINRRRLVDAIIYGYEVEKEKLYTVEIPNPNGGTYLALCKDVDGKLFFDTFFSEEWKTFGKCKLTESEIKKGFSWAWQFAEEAEDD